ncbi:hypothetical protein AMST5_03055 [freshwater sediment metagenome]|uniref:Uncharacterized protein n=1 Tax=freshwater sediment metagenome TaxID=556182 RepID=A0AA48M3X8_9ZZZZ
MRAKLSLVLFSAGALAGCVSNGTMLPGTLASQNGRTLSFEIEKAPRSGAVRATDPVTGEQFAGQYTGIVETVSAHSNGFATAGNATAFGFRRSTVVSSVADANAFLNGDKGTMLTCTMKIENDITPHGIGQCQDNKGVNYQLQF